MLKNQRAKFSLDKGITNLNAAYMSPLLKAVEKAGIEGILKKRNPPKVSVADFFETGELIRNEFAKLIRAKESNRVVIIPSASYGIASVVKNITLKPSQNIIIAEGQFPSNYYPWHSLAKESGAKLKMVNAPKELNKRGKKWNEQILNSINRNTRIVALGHIHWTDGTIWDLKKIRQRTREVGALLIIDGTQSIGALPFSVQSFEPDAVICAGYKWLMGPYSIGLAYYGEYFDGGKPIEENWINRLDSENFAGLINYQDQYHEGALRYEVGEHSNFILAPMLLKALEQVNEWRPKNIQEYCKTITARPVEILKEAGYWIEADRYRSHHLFGVRVPEEKDMQKIKARIRRNKISVSFRGDAIRVAPHVYNTEKDMMKLVACLVK